MEYYFGSGGNMVATWVEHPAPFHRREVARIDRGLLAAGRYAALIPTAALAPGAYICRIEADGIPAAKGMVQVVR